MGDQVLDELKERILQYLRTAGKAKNRDVARALNEEKATVDKAISELAKEDRIEFIYLGTSYVKVKGD